MESSRARGLKYGQDGNEGNFAVHPYSMNRLPLFAKTEEGRLIRLYVFGDYVNPFGHPMFMAGPQLILRNRRFHSN